MGYESFFRGQTSTALIRDARQRIERGLGVPDEALCYVLEIVEDILEAPEHEATHLEDVRASVKEAIESLADDAHTAEERADEEKRDRDSAEDAHTKALAELAETADEWKRRAEKAEHDLAEAVRNGHGLDNEAAARVTAAEDRASKAERELAEMRSNLEIALDRRKAAEIARGDLERIQELRKAKAERDELLAAAAVAIPEAEHPKDPTVHNWAWQVRTLGEDRRAVYKHKSEIEALAHMLDAEKSKVVALRDKQIEALEKALAHARQINPMRTRRKA